MTNARSSPQALLVAREPLQIVQATSAQMAAAWPLTSVCILILSRKHRMEDLEASNNAELFKVQPVSNKVDIEQVEQHLNTIIQALKTNSPYTRTAQKGKGIDKALLAAVPLCFKDYDPLERGADKMMGGEGAEFEKMHCVICLWSNPGSQQIFTDKEIQLFQHIVVPLLGYVEIYNSIRMYDRLLDKFRHDLRTPLTSISMIGGLLEQEQDGEMKEMGKMLHTAACNMDMLLKKFKNDLKAN